MESRKRWRYPFFFFIFFVEILTLAIGYLIFAALDVDDPTARDASMRLTHRELPSSKNGYLFLMKAKALEISSPELGQLYSHAFDFIKTQNPGLENAIAELVKKNEDSYELEEMADRCPLFQRSPTHESIDHFNNYQWLVELEELRVLRACSWFRQGEEKKAFQEAFNVVTTGRRCEDAGGSLTTACVGMLVQRMGWNTIRHFLAITTLDFPTLVDFTQPKENFTINFNGIANALRIEYAVDAEIIDLKWQRKLPLFYPPLPELPSMQVFLKPNRTKNRLVQGFQNLIDDFAHPALLQQTPRLEAKNRSIFLVIFSTNPIGEAFFITMTYGWDFTLKTKCFVNNDGAATQILLALKAYKKKNGQLPEKLIDLLPLYTEDIPKDDLTGQEWHYSKNLGIIWAGDPNLPFNIRNKLMASDELEGRIFKINF